LDIILTLTLKTLAGSVDVSQSETS